MVRLLGPELLAESFPALKFLTNNYIRGTVGGLGIVNLFAGFAELAFVFVAREHADHTFTDSNTEPR